MKDHHIYYLPWAEYCSCTHYTFVVQFLCVVSSFPAKPFLWLHALCWTRDKYLSTCLLVSCSRIKPPSWGSSVAVFRATWNQALLLVSFRFIAKQEPILADVTLNSYENVVSASSAETAHPASFFQQETAHVPHQAPPSPPPGLPRMVPHHLSWSQRVVQRKAGLCQICRRHVHGRICVCCRLCCRHVTSQLDI